MSSLERDILLERYRMGEEDLHDTVVELFDQALKENPGDPELYHSRGFIDEIRGRRLLESAAAFYEKGAEVARKDPQYFDYVKCDGQLLGVRRALGQLDQSIEYFKQRISENPEDLKAYALLTQAYYLADQLPEAQKVIEAAYKIDSEHPLITYWKGLIYSRLGRLDQALDLMNQTISHDPTFIDARYTLANLYERLQKLEEAVEEWQLIIAYHREHFPEVSMDWEEEQLARLKSKMEEH